MLSRTPDRSLRRYAPPGLPGAPSQLPVNAGAESGALWLLATPMRTFLPAVGSAALAGMFVAWMAVIDYPQVQPPDGRRVRSLSDSRRTALPANRRVLVARVARADRANLGAMTAGYGPALTILSAVLSNRVSIGPRVKECHKGVAFPGANQTYLVLPASIHTAPRCGLFCFPDRRTPLEQRRGLRSADVNANEMSDPAALVPYSRHGLLRALARAVVGVEVVRAVPDAPAVEVVEARDGWHLDLQGWRIAQCAADTVGRFVLAKPHSTSDRAADRYVFVIRDRFWLEEPTTNFRGFLNPACSSAESAARLAIRDAAVRGATIFRDSRFELRIGDAGVLKVEPAPTGEAHPWELGGSDGSMFVGSRGGATPIVS